MFLPLAQGLLTSRYLKGEVPSGSRASRNTSLQTKNITPELLEKLNNLNQIANARSQTLSEMAISWLLKDERVTSVLIGASSVAQLEENLKAIKADRPFSDEELVAIDKLTT